METQPQASPWLFFETTSAYQKSAALRGAIELDLFTAIGAGAGTAPEIAAKVAASERGTRVLCDYLAIAGFLTKQGDRYSLTPDTALFLDRRSPAYLGSAVEFLNSPHLMSAFDDVAGFVRKGGTVMSAHGIMEPDHPMWVNFARAMAPMMWMPAEFIAGLAGAEGELKALDIAAGHGLFGIAILRRNPKARVVAVDWANVLEVARENAEKMGVADRHERVAGSAFDADFGTGYDVVLLTNFLHHFDPPTCGKLLRKVHGALKPGGRAITLEFVPNDDRVTPRSAAGFSIMMLASTAGGDAYTFAELESMFRNAGFARSELHDVPNSEQRVVVSYR